jgi:hypothetical protein
MRGCIQRDGTGLAYKQGGYIRVGGHFGLATAKGNLGATLKVIMHDLDPRTMNFTPSAPVSAYLVSGNSTTKTAVVNSLQSDVPGAIYVVLRFEPTAEVIYEGLSKNKVTIAFSRTRGGPDIILPIDTSVVDTADNGQRTRSDKTKRDFFGCVKTLARQMAN